MLSRRNFLSALPTLAAINSLRPALPALAASRVRLGCQTNAWRIDPADFSQVLAVMTKLRDLGFDGFETGFRNVQGQFATTAEARKKIEAAGLTFFGAHIFLEKYDPQTQIAPIEMIQKIADGVASLGAQHLIVSGGGLIRDARVDPEALKRKAEALNTAGRYCQTKGLRLAYHNHGPEFQHNGLEINGLYKHTDASRVSFLMDCGWASRGGMNVPEFFARHHQRIIGLHLRDFKGDVNSTVQVPLGQGDFPLQQLVAAINKVKWSGWALNEEERLSGEKPGEAAVAPARETLRKVFGR